MRRFYRTHRSLVWVLAALFVVGTAFVVIWFEPHKLFIEETVNEPVPSVGATAPAERSPTENGNGGDEAAESSPSAPPKILAMGTFRDLEHATSGRAEILELADGRLFLRLEDLDTSNGPDLRVYLSEIPASDDWHAYGERFIDLGGLKGNRGDQNYEIPAGTDLSQIESAVVWCRRFTVGFGVAGLS